MTDTARCKACSHDFDADEIAAITVKSGDAADCVIRCKACGAANEVRVTWRAGDGTPPTVTTTGIVEDAADNEEVFDETVAPGIKPPPTATGSSN